MANSLDFQVSEVEKPQSFVITRKCGSESSSYTEDRGLITFKGVLISKSLPPFNANDLYDLRL